MNKTRVMIVDSERRFTSLVRTILQEWDAYEVMIVRKAKLAVKTALQFQPHVMLLNVEMSDKESDDMARATAVNARLRDIPIIFLTPPLRSEDSCYSAPKWSDEIPDEADRTTSGYRVRGQHCFNTSSQLKMTGMVPSSSDMKREKPWLNGFDDKNIAQSKQNGSGR
jgi:CheY-like chemotaxis protein